MPVADLVKTTANLIKQDSICEAQPFLKWAGGKSQLLNHLIEHVPVDFNKYIEPFLGGGALFFELNPDSAVISDANEELINTYQVVKTEVENLIDRLSNFDYSEDHYYAVRALDISRLNSVERAARFIFLNKTCFNGLYRVNKKGQFNVPFGKAKNPNFCPENKLRVCSLALQNTVIECGDYKDILTKYAEEKDFIYVDPPYHPVSIYSDFKRYTKDYFYPEDQIALRDMLMTLKERGCYILASNSYCDFICELYKGFAIKKVEARRYINCIGSKRGSVNEVIIVGNVPLTPSKRLASL